MQEIIIVGIILVLVILIFFMRRSDGFTGTSGNWIMTATNGNSWTVNITSSSVATSSTRTGTVTATVSGVSGLNTTANTIDNFTAGSSQYRVNNPAGTISKLTGTDSLALANGTFVYSMQSPSPAKSPSPSPAKSPSPSPPPSKFFITGTYTNPNTPETFIIISPTSFSFTNVLNTSSNRNNQPYKVGSDNIIDFGNFWDGDSPSSTLKMTGLYISNTSFSWNGQIFNPSSLPIVTNPCGVSKFATCTTPIQKAIPPEITNNTTFGLFNCFRPYQVKSMGATFTTIGYDMSDIINNKGQINYNYLNTIGCQCKDIYDSGINVMCTLSPNFVSSELNMNPTVFQTSDGYTNRLNIIKYFVSMYGNYCWGFQIGNEITSETRIPLGELTLNKTPPNPTTTNAIDAANKNLVYYFKMAAQYARKYRNSPKCKIISAGASDFSLTTPSVVNNIPSDQFKNIYNATFDYFCTSDVNYCVNNDPNIDVIDLHMHANSYDEFTTIYKNAIRIISSKNYNEYASGAANTQNYPIDQLQRANNVKPLKPFMMREFSFSHFVIPLVNSLKLKNFIDVLPRSSTKQFKPGQNSDFYYDYSPGLKKQGTYLAPSDIKLVQYMSSLIDNNCPPTAKLTFDEIQALMSLVNINNVPAKTGNGLFNCINDCLAYARKPPTDPKIVGNNGPPPILVIGHPLLGSVSNLIDWAPSTILANQFAKKQNPGDKYYDSCKGDNDSVNFMPIQNVYNAVKSVINGRTSVYQYV